MVSSTPSRARALAQPFPRPLLAPQTMAFRPAIPRSMYHPISFRRSAGEHRMPGWRSLSRGGRSSLQHARHASPDHHFPAALAIFGADVARRRAATAGIQADQLHAQLVQIAIVAGVGLLDFYPEFIERHGFAREHQLDVAMSAGLQIIDQSDAPFRPVVAEMHLKCPRAQHVADGEL